MGEDHYNWSSFWDLASPEQAARRLTAFYGASAATAAAHCALAAHGDGRDDDYRFWLAVFNKLRIAGPHPAIMGLADAPN